MNKRKFRRFMREIAPVLLASAVIAAAFFAAGASQTTTLWAASTMPAWLLKAIQVIRQPAFRQRLNSALRRILTLGGATGITSFAAWIAGRRRHPDMRTQWRDHYEEARSTGAKPIVILSGFLSAAVTIRTTDLFKPFWPALDWLVSTDRRINITVAMVCGAQTVYLCKGDDGLYGFLNGGELCVGVTGTGMFLLLRYLRKSRGIEIAGQDIGDKDDEK